MYVTSSGSVTVIWLDRERVTAAVNEAARRLAGDKPEISKIILFGSLARGDAVPGSDADVLIVLSTSRRRFLNRIPEYTLSDVPVGVDIFPYTEKELSRMLAEGNPFIRQAVSEGIILFERKIPSDG